MNCVYLNENFLPLDQAKTSVLDRGFLFGDGVYEVISVYHGKLFRVYEHLSRLNENLKAIRLSLSWTHQQWLAIFHELLRRN